MIISRVASASLLVFLVVLTPAIPAQNRPGPDGPASAPRAADFLPDSVVAAVVVRDGGARAEAFRALLDRIDFYQSPACRNLLRNPGTLKARLLLEGLAANAGSTPWETVANVLGRDLALGVVPRPGSRKPDVVLAVITRDRALTAEILEWVHNLTGLPSLVEAVARMPKRPTRVADVPVFEPKRGICHAVIGNAVIVATRRAALEQGLAAMLAGKGRFSDRAAFAEARQAVPSGALAWAYLDVGKLRPAMAAGGKWPERLREPFGGFLVGGVWGHLATADRALLWAETEFDTLTVRGSVETTRPLGASHRGFTVTPTAARWKASALPGFVAEVAVTRGWADLFAEREALFDLQGSGALAKFVTNINTLFGGLDFVDDLLPDLEGATRLVVAGETIPAGRPVPSPRLPAFALVAQLKEGAEAGLGRRLEKAVQMGFSLLNLNALQKGEATYLLQTERYREQRLLTTAYDEVPENPGVRYNFKPAAAVVRDNLIIATSEPMLKSVVNAVLDGRAGPAAGVQDRVDLSLPRVAAALADNHRELVAEQMLKKDISRRAAAREIDGLLGLLGLFDRASLEARSTARRSHVSLRITLKPVSPAAPARRKL